MASNGPLLDSKIDYTTTAAMLNMSQYSYSTLNNSTLHQRQSFVRGSMDVKGQTNTNFMMGKNSRGQTAAAIKAT